MFRLEVVVKILLTTDLLLLRPRAELPRLIARSVTEVPWLLRIDPLPGERIECAAIGVRIGIPDVFSKVAIHFADVMSGVVASAAL